MKPHSKVVVFKRKKHAPSLDNYKNQHRKRAEEMGVLEKFLAAPTLTKARKIVFPKK